MKGYFFTFNPTTTVSDFKKQFNDLIGGVLRIYKDNKEVPSDVTLASIGAKIGEKEIYKAFGYSCPVSNFVKTMSDLGLTVKVFTSDNSIAVLDNVTLWAIRDIPNGADETQVKKFCAYDTSTYNDDIDVVKGVSFNLHECTDDFQEDEEFFEDGNYYMIASVENEKGEVKFLFGGEGPTAEDVRDCIECLAEKGYSDNLHLYYFEYEDDITYNPYGIRYYFESIIDGDCFGDELECYMNGKNERSYKNGWRYNLLIDGKVVASYEG